MDALRTEQEEFWEGAFGADYVQRNEGAPLVGNKTAMFASILKQTRGVKSVRELGANIGLNILALKGLLPSAKFQAVEINRDAFSRLEQIPDVEAFCGSLFDEFPSKPVDLCFTAGVLIHLNPDKLSLAYSRLYEGSTRYVMVAEYYNPAPVEVPYRGHAGKLFKRDFAGEMMDRYAGLRLLDYGFVYHRDPVFPGDDLTWFLMEKTE